MFDNAQSLTAYQESYEDTIFLLYEVWPQRLSKVHFYDHFYAKIIQAHSIMDRFKKNYKCYNFFYKIIFDLKCHFYVMEKYCDLLYFKAFWPNLDIRFYGQLLSLFSRVSYIHYVLCTYLIIFEGLMVIHKVMYISYIDKLVRYGKRKEIKLKKKH